MQSCVPRRKSGFTLIELLVVIAIIAILAAILFPVFAQARAKARQAACLSNQKQIGTGLMLYAQDYDETFPGNSSRFCARDSGQGIQTPPTFNADPNTRAANLVPRDIQPYIKNWDVFICPEAQPRTGAVNGNALTPNNLNTSYLYNGIVMFRLMSVIPNPADIIFLHEEKEYVSYASMRPQHETYASAAPTIPPPDGGRYTSWNSITFDFVHNEGANFLYCDGHVKFSRKSAVLFTAFGAATSGANSVAADRKLTIVQPGVATDNGSLVAPAF